MGRWPSARTTLDVRGGLPVIDRSAIDESADHLTALTDFTKEIHAINVSTEDPSDEQLAIAHHLDWAIGICREHHSNLLHVYKLATEKAK